MTIHEVPEGRPVAINLYARPVVALDGSARAELVLPYVEAIAAPAAAATMTPLAPNVAATPIDPTAAVAAERRAVESYLRTLAQRLHSCGLAVSYEDHEGAPADVIITRARAGCEPDRHDHPWPQRSPAPGLRQHRRRGAAARALPGSAGARSRGGRRVRVTYLTQEGAAR